MSDVLTENLDLWSSALLTKSTAGRGSNGKVEAYGIKKLRELILELAVRGKLVPQDPNDEPASVLLQRFGKEKARLIKKGEIRKEKELSPIAKDELPFVLPTNWEVERLGTVSYLITKGTTPTTLGYAYVDRGVSFVKVENIDRGRIEGDTISQFIDKEANQALERSQLAVGDVLFSIAGTIGKTCIVYEKDLPANTNQALAIIRGTSTVFDTRYLLIQLDSYVAEATRSKARGGAMPNVSLGDLSVLVLPVPPLAEQHRIVAKVDELMALCDQLEQQQTDSIEAHQTLVKTLLGTLASAASSEEFAEAWTRIADHFDTLFISEQSIDKLKQTILQLAVMGKLVPQDPNDEPASVLLEKVIAEKQRLIKAKEIQQLKKLPAINADEMPFRLPRKWQWAYVWDVAKVITSGSRDWAKYYSDIGAIFVTMGNLSRGDYKLRLDSIRYVSPPEDGEGSRTRLEPNDLIISITGDVGNLGLIPDDFGEAYINQHTCLLRFMPDCQNRYFPELLRSPWAKYQFDAPQRGVKNSFRLSDVGEMIIPIPPLAEQQRIVTKVDELMVLCDALKARLSEAQTTQIHLADAIVEQAVA